MTLMVQQLHLLSTPLDPDLDENCGLGVFSLNSTNESSIGSTAMSTKTIVMTSRIAFN